jgi:predicted phosphodiesterase
METLVISDTHLGKYDEKKDKFLKDLIKEYDRIIINGDFWDNWGGYSFLEFVNLKQYKELFELLKSKETVYIYGNHDHEAEKEKHLANMFSDIQCKEYNIEIGQYRYHFEHGHRFFYDNPKAKFVNFYLIIDKHPILRRMANRFTNFSYRNFPNRLKKTKVAKKKNQYIKSVKPNDVVYVVGHTHIPEIDTENMFINTGCIMEGLTTYLEIDEYGEPKLLTSQWYR